MKNAKNRLAVFSAFLRKLLGGFNTSLARIAKIMMHNDHNL